MQVGSSYVDGEWVSVLECKCGQIIPTKDAIIVFEDYEYLGRKGQISTNICKECYREKQLNKLDI